MPDNHQVPQSITFGKKVLFIPSLAEMGIPIGGLGIVTMGPELIEYTYDGGRWINRGEALLMYRFNAFTKEKTSFFEKLSGKDPITHQTWTIVSPVSGLLISNREELTTESNPIVNLLYHDVNRPLLPVILIPNDEPLPDTNNFYTYQSMSSWLSHYFNLLLIRHRSDPSPGRLKDYITRSEWSMDNYPKYLKALINRDPKAFGNYVIREMNTKDFGFIHNVQKMRSKYVDLRDKLLHLSKEFGESI